MLYRDSVAFVNSIGGKNYIFKIKGEKFKIKLLLNTIKVF